jgi:hypothetical protein
MAIGVFPAANEWFNSPIPDYFPGPTVAGMNEFQQQGFQDQIAALQGGADEAQGYLDLVSGYARDPSAVNPYISEVIQNYQDQMQRGFDRNMLPSLRGQQVSVGGAGSSASGIAQGLAASDQTRQISDNVAQMLMGAQDRAMAALPGAIQGATSATRAPGSLMSAWGGQNQALAQQMLQGEQDRWNYYRDAPERRLGMYSSLVGGQPAASGAGTREAVTQGPSSNYNTMMGALGGLSMMAPSIYNSFSQPQAPQTFGTDAFGNNFWT